MALIAITVYSTEENKKDECLSRTLLSLSKTVDFLKHRLILSINGMTKNTMSIIESSGSSIKGLKVILNVSNIGTAEAINKAWKQRLPGEHCLKMDDDVEIHQSGWLDDLEESIRRDRKIGIIGLKRKDCWESPERNDFYKSELRVLPKQPHEKWIIAEKVNHVMGTCQLYNSDLLDKIGYLWQPGLYGFDDSLAAVRCSIAGFYSCFLPYIEIDHIDNGDTPYQKWKEAQAAKYLTGIEGKPSEYTELVIAYSNGSKPIYYNPFEK